MGVVLAFCLRGLSGDKKAVSRLSCIPVMDVSHPWMAGSKMIIILSTSDSYSS